ncbi:Type 1 glutamine amidotransferase-like domain-containing protein [candidate division FCPU426 bacterium]|nr:Type 1 glutamine amidotransferase-like domain-containing protein [candidate division FCPU426 bacterium]
MKKAKPVFLLAGGNWQTPNALLPVLEEILAETGMKNPQVAYVGAANNDNPSFFIFAKRLFAEAGAAEVLPIFLAQKRPDIKTAHTIFSRVQAVFFSGGDVDEGMYWLSRHNLISCLQGLYAKGTLFFGLSAGSIMLGTRWVRWKNPHDDASAELFDCLNIAPVICDTHAEKDHWQELKEAVMLAGDGSTGYGIPTGGLLRVEQGGALHTQFKSAVCYLNQSGRVIKGKSITPL